MKDQLQQSTTKIPKPDFYNGDLSFDIEKILGNDEIEIKKDVIDNDGEPSYYLDVNDSGYSYVDQSERDMDYQLLVGFLKANNKEFKCL